MAKKRVSDVVSFSRVMNGIDNWLDEEENNDEEDLHELNGNNSDNEDLSVNIDSSEQNLIEDELDEEW